MAVYKILKCTVKGCGYTKTESQPKRSGTWCVSCRTLTDSNKAKCPACSKTAREAGPQSCPHHPEAPTYYSEKWYVKAAGVPPFAVSPKKSDAVGEEAAMTRNRIEGRGFLNRVKRTTWDDAEKKFLRWAESNTRPKSVAMFKNSFRRLTPRFGHLTLDRVNAQLLEDHKAEYLEEGNAASTINKDLTTIKRLFTKSIEWKLVEVNPLTSVAKLREPDPRERILSDEEIARLLDRCKRKKGCQCESVEKCKCKKRPRRYTYLITLTGLHAGLRKNDVLTLKRSEIDFRRGVIRKVIQKRTTNRTVSVPMTTTLKEALKAHIDGMEALSIAGWLFPSPIDKTKPIRPDTNFGFEDACKEAKIPDFHFHDLRHTFATLFLQEIGMKMGRDASLAILQRLLAHSDPRSTAKYAHVLDDNIRDAMADFGASFNHK